MRIAIDARSLNERNNSNRTYWSELIRALGKRPELELLLVSNAPLSEADVPSNAEVIVSPVNGRWFSLVTLPLIAHKRDVDVAHVQYSVSPFFKVPVVTTIHDVSFFVEPSWFGKKDRFLLGRTIPLACQRAERILAPSSASRQEILRYVHVAIEKVLTVPLGTPTELLSTPPDRTMLDERLGDHPYALLVGGASLRKNVSGAIEAVRLARRSIPDLQLLITGNLPVPSTEPWVVSPGTLGEPALAAAYRGAHALLHPSYHEGFGFTVLEAMALGCPVVCSDRGSLPEIAEDAAILCDPRDALSMAEGLRRLVDPAICQSYVEKGRRRAAAFTWDATATATIKAYRKALD